MTYELSRLEAVAEGDQEFIIKVLEVFVIEVTEDVSKMFQSFKYNDFATLSKIAHKIKPNLILLGMQSATDACINIEKNRLNPIPLEQLWAHLDHLDKAVKQVVLELKKNYKF